MLPPGHYCWSQPTCAALACGQPISISMLPAPSPLLCRGWEQAAKEEKKKAAEERKAVRCCGVPGCTPSFLCRAHSAASCHRRRLQCFTGLLRVCFRLQAEQAAKVAKEAAEMGLQTAMSKTYQHKKMDKAAAATPTLTAPAAAPAAAGGKAAATAAADAKGKGGKAAGGKKH